jgi:hypothetical protein
MNAMMLPRVFNQQNVKQQISVVAHVVPVGETAVPQKLCEELLRELWILPAAILQQLKSIFADVRVFNEFLDVTERAIRVE